MAAEEIGRSDPEVRAALAAGGFERRQRATRIGAALVLFAFAVVGPFAAAPLVGDPGATVGAIVASILAAGWGVAVWPWRWSDAERTHHALAAIWSQVRAGADTATPWERYAAWARADED